MKTFKTHRAAHLAALAAGTEIIRVRLADKPGRFNELYIVPDRDYAESRAGDAVSEIDVIGLDGRIAGNVTPRHLKRLGNANWAQPGRARG
jgi:hypothetical protein